MRLQQLVRAYITSAAFLGTLLILQAASAMGQGLAKDLGPQPLADALDIFAADTGLQVVYHSEIATGLKSQGARAGLSAEETLRQLLRETGLTFEFLNDRTIAIRAVSAVSGSDSSQTPSAPHAGSSGQVTAKTGDWLDRLRLAQAESSTNASSSAASAAAEKNARASDPSVVELGEVVVTGTNIRGVYPSSSPVDIYTAEDIERSGATTTEEFIEKLPQNFSFTSDNAPAGVTTGAGPANAAAINSPDLRGLGVGSTLTLLNGRRLALANEGRAVDVSMIPAGGIKRVEVLTDGASAIYGSDAIGGVVNFVLRDDFEGAETRLRYGGVTDGNLRQSGFGQMFGGAWHSGHGVVSYDFQEASALKSTDRPYFEQSDSIADTNLTPQIERHSLLATGGQEISDRLSIDTAIALSRRDVKNYAATNSDTATSRTYRESETEMVFANLGADYAISDSLNASVVLTHTDTDLSNLNVTEPSGVTTSSFSTYSALNVTSGLDGSLFELASGHIRFVIGADYMREESRSTLSALTAGNSTVNGNLGRATTAAYGEVFIPVIGAHQGVPLAHRLELSVAGRYTRHEDDSDPRLTGDFDFEGSSPKIGVLWAPFRSLGLRATWGESFRAPTVSQTNPSGATMSLFGNLVVGGTTSTGMILGGPAAALEPETAETFTFGIDYRPVGHPEFRISATYYNIDYVDRLGRAVTTLALPDPASFPEIIHRPASAAEIEQLLRDYPVLTNNTGVNLTDLQAASVALFARSPNMWILDQRIRNLSLSQQDGFDVSIGSQFKTPVGDVSMGAHLSRILSYRQQGTENSPVVSVVDSVLQPVSFKGNAYVDFARGGFSSRLTVRYVDEYGNPFARDASVPRIVDEWITVDLSAVYDFGQDGGGGILNGVRLSLSTQNLFDQEPPLVYRTTGTTLALANSPGYDPANANPLGRVVSLGVTKRW